MATKKFNSKEELKKFLSANGGTILNWGTPVESKNFTFDGEGNLIEGSVPFEKNGDLLIIKKIYYLYKGSISYISCVENTQGLDVNLILPTNFIEIVGKIYSESPLIEGQNQSKNGCYYVDFIILKEGDELLL